MGERQLDAMAAEKAALKFIAEAREHENACLRDDMAVLQTRFEEFQTVACRKDAEATAAASERASFAEKACVFDTATVL